MGLLDSITTEAAAEAVANQTRLHPNEFKITGAKCSGEGSSFGDGYTSDIKVHMNIIRRYYSLLFQVLQRINITCKKISTKEEFTCGMICKFRVSKSSPKQHWWDAMKLFERETEFYSKVVPKMQVLAGRKC